MRVVVPYTHLRREVLAPLAHWDQELVDVSGSDRDYFDVLSEIWQAGVTTVLVEHDIVVHPTALDELADCPNDWCGYPHEYAGELVYGMGCVKFGADLIARNPDAMIRVGTLFDANYPKRHWYRLDPWLQGVILPGRGEVKCKHPTTVGHLGSGKPPLHTPIPFR